LQGANASVTGIANLFGPGLFTLTFAFAIGGGREFNLPGAPFLIASFLLAAAAVAAWLATRE
jgi:DHA1 family tetracycline resistance protein-like MFS transporter